MNEMKFYRYDWVEYASFNDDDIYQSHFPNPTIYINEYNLVRETEKGYWISYGFYTGGKLRSHARWISKVSRKKYAYPTKEEAKFNFIKRQEKRIRILEHQLSCCKIALSKVKND